MLRTVTDGGRHYRAGPFSNVPPSRCRWVPWDLMRIGETLGSFSTLSRVRKDCGEDARVTLWTVKEMKESLWD